MANKIAFEAASEDLAGATFAYADGKTFDLAAALKDGGGQIVLDLDKDQDRAIADILSSNPGVKPVAVKKASK